MTFKCFLALVLVAFGSLSILAPRVCSAEDAPALPAPRVLVLRTEGWEHVDDLREALAKDLGATFVDPKEATAATGELDVRFDASSKKVTVRYRDFGEALAREIVVGAGEPLARKAAVLLGGNLARGSANRPDASQREAATIPVAATGPAEESHPDEDTVRLNQLDATLSVFAEAKTHWRVVGVGSMVLGTALLASSFALGHYDDARSWAGAAGGGLLGVGVVLTIPVYTEPASDMLDKLRRERAAGGPGTLQRIEAVLEDRASHARTTRKVIAVVATSLGVIATGAGVALAFSDLPTDRREARGAAAGLLIGGAAYTLLGIYRFVAPSNIEEAQAIYRQSWPAAAPAVSLRPSIAPTRGGGMLGVTGTF